ncbi:MAG: PilN domain-containing protein [Bryobacter sp.]|nr:PilN domain-containing protein [Bryobacter sp.]
MSTEQIAAEANPVVRRTAIPLWKRWTSFGSGVGIAVVDGALEVVLAEVRPQGVEVVDALRLERIRERPAAEWGAEYDALLKKHKWQHVAAMVVLPAREVISRTVSLAGVGAKETDAALRYQLDGLHPFEEDRIAFGYGRLEAPHASTVAVGIAQAETMEEYATLFEEAGVDLAGFVTPAAAYYSALRVLQAPPADELLLVNEAEGALEIYAETASHPLFFVELPSGQPRAVEAAKSQVRFTGEGLSGKIAGCLPHAESAVVYSPLPFAAALVSALPKQALPLNLLPESRRRVTSRLQWVPTLVLVTLLALVVAGLLSFQEFENRRLIAELEAETAKLNPQLIQLRTADRELAAAKAKLANLEEFLRRPQTDLDSLKELTRILPPEAWVSRMEMTADTVSLMGEIDQATEILKLIDASPMFAETQFTSQIGRSTSGKEVFQVKAKRVKR